MSHADLLFSTFYERPDENLRRWDELNAARGLRLTAVAGNDAHANVGLRLGDRTGKEFLGVSLDPYERSFRVVRNHVLLDRAQPLAADSLVAALRGGRSYIAFDIFGDSTGFRFTAHGPVETKTMGDEIALPAGGEVRLKVRTPAAGRVVFFRDGQVIREFEEVTDAELAVGERGVYRAEVYLQAARLPGGAQALDHLQPDLRQVSARAAGGGYERGRRVSDTTSPRTERLMPYLCGALC